MENRPRTVAPSQEAIPTGELLTRIGAAALLPEVLRDLGVEPQAVFDVAGVDMVHFADLESLVPVADIARVAQLCVQASGRADLGLLIAARARAGAFGLLGRLMARADTLRTALNDIGRYGHLNHRDIVATLTVSEGIATMQFALGGAREAAATLYEDGTVGVVFHAIRAYLGESWRPIAVRFSHKLTADAETYRQFFDAPVRFNTVSTALEFPAADLERRSVVDASERRAEVEAAADIASAKLAIGFEETVQWRIRAHLSDPDLSVGRVAALTGMSRRSLNRWLAVRGVTFAGLLRSVRFATARQLLLDSETPLSEIATAIGYGEPSVFSRTFRAWSGVSPREWRRQHGRAGEGEPGMHT